MKALTYRAFGAARDVLRIEDLEPIRPEHGDVRVRLAYSGVNPSDVKARAGARAGVTALPWPVIVPHSDGAGIIESVGAGVDPARLGQPVWIWNGQWRRPFGTAAETITLPAEQAVALPDGISAETGATLGIPGLTACFAVFASGEVSGKTVLVHGGAGTVGYLAVQLARWGGAHVIATARGAGIERARAAGAATVIAYDSPDLDSLILGANQGKPVDHIVDVEFGLNAATNAAVIAENGSICAYGSAREMAPTLPFYPLMFKAVTLRMALIYLLKPQQRASTIARLNQALMAGALVSPIAAIHDLSDAAAAHEAVERGGRDGSVLIRLPGT